MSNLSHSDQEAMGALAQNYVTNPATVDEISLVKAQLGRYPRGMIAVGARCVCGTPLAVITRPLVDGKIPFPTSLYLTSPEAVKAMSHLEANGTMAMFNERLSGSGQRASREQSTDAEQLKAGYLRAHNMYLAFRHAMAVALGDSEEHIIGTSAGGMPTRVKCLHALSAQALVMGHGVNPLADEALELASEEFSPRVCRCVLRLERKAE